MQENIPEMRIKSYDLYKRQAGHGLAFLIKNPACSIPVITGCCSILFVFSLFLIMLILYYLSQY